MHVYSKWSESALIYLLKHGKNWAQHVENSTDRVHIELYTARRLRNLFKGIPLRITKHQCYHLKFLSPVFGWFLVAEGVKP